MKKMVLGLKNLIGDDEMISKERLKGVIGGGYEDCTPGGYPCYINGGFVGCNFWFPSQTCPFS